MGLRTFNVRGGSRKPANIDYQDMNDQLGNNATMFNEIPGSTDGSTEAGFGAISGRLEPRNAIYNDPMGIEGQYSTLDDEYVADIADKDMNRVAAGEPMGASKPDAVGSLDGDKYPKDPEATNRARNARLAAAGLETVGGVINAISRHNDYVNASNMKILQASRQQQYIQADAARAVLREGTKATDRKGQALINAVAQGQSASGDIAQTAMSNEDVYAAQNAMNIEINAMRSIYGLESEKIALESNQRISRINRNTSIAQNIIGGVTKATVA